MLRNAFTTATKASLASAARMLDGAGVEEAVDAEADAEAEVVSLDGAEGAVGTAFLSGCNSNTSFRNRSLMAGMSLPCGSPKQTSGLLLRQCHGRSPGSGGVVPSHQHPVPPPAGISTVRSHASTPMPLLLRRKLGGKRSVAL